MIKNKILDIKIIFKTIKNIVLKEELFFKIIIKNGF